MDGNEISCKINNIIAMLTTHLGQHYKDELKSYSSIEGRLTKEEVLEEYTQTTLDRLNRISE